MLYIKKQKGFTIVETMIVLGVTGVLFVSVSLLISGQTERYRYRDSMYRLQQQVQAHINDVQSGQFYTVSGAGNTDDTVIGKRLLFCNNSSSSSPCNGAKPTDQQIKDGIIQLSGGTESLINESNQQIPGGINFIGAKPVDSSSADNFNFDIKFTNNPSGSSSSSSLQVDLFNTSIPSQVLSSQNSGKGYLLCFEGYKKGSLQLGSKELGNTVKLNLVDSRCD